MSRLRDEPRLKSRSEDRRRTQIRLVTFIRGDDLDLSLESQPVGEPFFSHHSTIRSLGGMWITVSAHVSHALPGPRWAFHVM